MYKIADKIGLLPAGLDNGSYSYLEGGALQKLPEISLDRITSGVFQDEVEAYVSACFPQGIELFWRMPQRKEAS